MLPSVVPSDEPAGLGAMTEWRDIVGIVVERFKLVKNPAEDGKASS